MIRKPVGEIDPAYIRKNLDSLRAIGGVYDLIAVAVEQEHKEILNGDTVPSAER